MLDKQRISSRLPITALGMTLLLAVAACGGGGTEAAAKVATLGSTDTKTSTADSTPQSNQDALLAYAACMRENGIDMADPTFDASGNPTTRLFGPESGFDPQSSDFQTAQKACGDLLQGVTFGGGQGRRLDRDAIQESMNNFTACLRDNGLDVDDIDFAAGGPGGTGGPGNGGFGGGGNATTGSAPAGATTGDGSTPANGGGGFGPPPGADGQGPNGQGFDPTARIIERLGLDATDPAVTKAVDACQSILESAFQPTTTTTA